MYSESRSFARFSAAVLAIVTMFTCLTPTASMLAAPARQRTIELMLNGRRVEGMPLTWSEAIIYLLGRDGRLWSFSPSEASDFKQTSSSFSALPASVMTNQLRAELGEDFSISSTPHFLVAHPRGGGQKWSQRFEDLYRSFSQYFAVRGFNLKQPQFPLVAIVYPNQDTFMHAAAAEGSVSPNTLGYYSGETNRIMLFDVGGGNGGEQAWQQNADTIVHETTHQLAFNTGLHTRFGEAPRWVVEGLGTMFEARGIWNNRTYRNQRDRINAGRLVEYKQKVGEFGPDTLADMISNDRLFQSDPMGAYALAWAFSFYLSETHPRQYATYLQKTADRPAFSGYSSQQRMADFTSVFGPNMRLMDSQFKQFMAKLN